ncbi:MAG: 16S rRNA (cytidine(1402)-2'-O)-methyltransferase [Acidimicrobiia bacterium]
MAEGVLFVCATPIGNLGDVSDRLRETLGSVDVVYAEDTRRTAKLLSFLGVDVPVLSLFAGNEMERSERLVDEVSTGRRVALVSDAGTPAVSDPGASAVAMALDRGLTVRVVPGPSAVTAALAISGLGGDRFVFEGFLPRKGRERRRRLESICGEERPVVLFVTPHRAAQDLSDLANSCGEERRVVVTRELTKLHEEVWSGTLAGSMERFGGEVKGELTVVLASADRARASAEAAIAEGRRLVAEGASTAEAARRAARFGGVPRRTVYQALIDDQEPS